MPMTSDQEILNAVRWQAVDSLLFKATCAAAEIVGPPDVGDKADAEWTIKKISEVRHAINRRVNMAEATVERSKKGG